MGEKSAHWLGYLATCEVQMAREVRQPMRTHCSVQPDNLLTSPDEFRFLGHSSGNQQSALACKELNASNYPRAAQTLPGKLPRRT